MYFKEFDLNFDLSEYESTPFLIRCRNQSDLLKALDLLKEFNDDGIITGLREIGCKSQHLTLNSDFDSTIIDAKNIKLNIKTACNLLLEKNQSPKYPWYISGVLFDQSNQENDKIEYFERKLKKYSKIIIFQKKKISLLSKIFKSLFG